MRLRTLLFVVAALACASPLYAQWPVGSRGIQAASLASVGASSPVADAMGDAQDAFGDGPPLLDIDTVSVAYDDEALNISMTFFGEITPPELGLPNGLVGVIELDVDQNALTGGPPLQANFSPPFPTLDVGVDFLIVLFQGVSQPGEFAVVDPDFGLVAAVPAAYTANSIATRVPLALLGDDDGLVNFTAIIGTEPQPTDAMDVIGSSVPVPEPGALTLMVVAVAATLGQMVRRV